jgi:hypothetical protein
VEQAKTYWWLLVCAAHTALNQAEEAGVTMKKLPSEKAAVSERTRAADRAKGDLT